MKRLTLGLLTLLLLPLSACDTKPEEPEAPTIADKSAEEAAEITTEAACEYVARCGIIEVTCADCVEGEDCGGGCTSEVTPVTVQECTEEMGPEIAQTFGCTELTAEEIAMVDECLAALPDAECPSVEVVQDGEPADDLTDDLQACEVFEQIQARCDYYGQSEPGNPGSDEPPPAEPMPG